MSQPKHILFINTGSPSEPTTAATKIYLKKFLMDGRVIDIPRLLRWILVNIIIVPFRSSKSAALYRKIWTKDGSPLVVESNSVAKRVERQLGDDYRCSVAMVYGEPSIETSLKKIAKSGAKRLVVFPLFPQYAAATYGSVIAGVTETNNQLWSPIPLSFVSPYSRQDEFADVFAEKIAASNLDFKTHHLLLSFHSIPVGHVEKTAKVYDYSCDPASNCCETPKAEFCYRNQCLSLSNSIAQKLGLNGDCFSVGFQSKLGRAEWLAPSTVDQAKNLLARGHKKIAVACPSFPVDCLETLEEINIGLREEFLSGGGEDFQFITCPGDSERFAAFCAKHIARSIAD